MEIHPIQSLQREDLLRLITGYTSPERYVIHKTETDETTLFRLDLERLAAPYVKHYDPPDAETEQRYLSDASNGFSLGVYDGGHLIGLGLAEPQAWNNSLQLWEFHIGEAHRGRGLGTRLMQALAERGRSAGLRAIFCETQTTNVPAIRFYRKMGFTLDGLNLSFYTNDDWPDGEVAIFMKWNL